MYWWAKNRIAWCFSNTFKHGAFPFLVDFVLLWNVSYTHTCRCCTLCISIRRQRPRVCLWRSISLYYKLFEKVIHFCKDDEFERERDAVTYVCVCNSWFLKIMFLTAFVNIWNASVDDSIDFWPETACVCKWELIWTCVNIYARCCTVPFFV